MASVRNEIRQKKFSPLYVLYGTEPYLIEEFQRTIIDHAVDKEAFEFNFAQYDMEETPVQQVIEDAQTLPFLGEYRVIVVKNPFFLTGKQEKKSVEHDLDRLERYVEAPSPHAIVIFSGSYEKLDQRKKIVKRLKKNGELLSFSTENEKVIFELLRERAETYGAVLTQQANERLLQLVGPHLSRLIGEIDKMALYAGDGGEITADVVDLLCAKTLESNVFALVDRVVRRNLPEAFVILNDLIKQKEDPIRLLALLVRQFRIIFQVKQLKESGYTQGQMAKRLSLHPYAVKVAAQQGKGFEKERLLQWLSEMTETDFAMKTGKMDKRLALELILTKLAR
ncbi:MAG TPA: DNA polymerase III subunit delta [Bacillales bacterium]|nr:DNA polymerase III subunit delta [Bacillales bacterium]